MADIEADRRQAVVSLLGTLCDCHQEAPVVLTNGRPGFIDVLCRPHAPELNDLCFAIEVKAKAEIGDAEMAAWFAQCRAYVGAVPIGALTGLPPTVAVFAWLVGIRLDPRPGEQLRMDGMRMLAQHLRVGVAIDGTDNSAGRPGLKLIFGPSCEVLNQPRGWRPRARERLLAARIEGGVKRRPG